jgi:hypothetical protein
MGQVHGGGGVEDGLAQGIGEFGDGRRSKGTKDPCSATSWWRPEALDGPVEVVMDERCSVKDAEDHQPWEDVIRGCNGGGQLERERCSLVRHEVHDLRAEENKLKMRLVDKGRRDQNTWYE